MADMKAMIQIPENQAATVPVWALVLAAPAGGSLARELVGSATDRTQVNYSKTRDLHRIFEAHYAGPPELSGVGFDLFVDFAIVAARCSR
jgi:hypothetical protein